VEIIPIQTVQQSRCFGFKTSFMIYMVELKELI